MPAVSELFRRKCEKNQFYKNVGVGALEFCPQYCARIATEIYDK